MPRRGGIVVSGPAGRDLRGIWRHVADEGGSERADALLARIEQVWNLAARTPQMGRPEPRRGGDMRSLLVGRHHRIFYTPKQTHIEIARVLDTRRDQDKAWAERAGKDQRG